MTPPPRDSAPAPAPAPVPAAPAAEGGNHLFYGDNLATLRESVPDASVDLVYLDPPFNSAATYSLLFRAPDGARSEAQVQAFEDTWRWDRAAEAAFDEVMASGHGGAAEMLRAMRRSLGDNDLMAYLAMMAVRLLHLRRALRPTGSLYLHCDPTASHYLKVLLDGVFGAENYRSEIVWKRSTAHSDSKQGRNVHGHVHDTILFYTRSDRWTWNTQYTAYDDTYIKSHYSLVEEGTGRRHRTGDLTAAKGGGDTLYEWRVKRELPDGPWQADPDDEYRTPRDGWAYKGVRPYSGRAWAYSRDNMLAFEREGRIHYSAGPNGGMLNYKRYLDEMPGVPLQDLWTDIPPINSQARERLGYPTQKPLALLERIIAASSNPGDTVLDPFCGCGTAVQAAQKLGRRWIGMDITHLAIGLVERRLKDAFPGLRYRVHGTPADLTGARDLAARDKYGFQWWAVSLVDAVPYGGRKRGADGGVDGHIYFKPDGRATERAVVSVKGGDNVSVGMVRDLRTAMANEGAEIGVFVTLAEPTGPMLAEAARAGFYEPPAHPKVPRVQILTVADLFAGRRPNIPMLAPAFRRARARPRRRAGWTCRAAAADRSARVRVPRGARRDRPAARPAGTVRAGARAPTARGRGGRGAAPRSSSRASPRRAGGAGGARRGRGRAGRA